MEAESANTQRQQPKAGRRAPRAEAKTPEGVHVKFPYEEFDLSGVHTYPLKSRKSKARVEDFARPCPSEAPIGDFVRSLPDMLAAADFKAGTRRPRDQDGSGSRAD